MANTVRAYDQARGHGESAAACTLLAFEIKTNLVKGFGAAARRRSRSTAKSNCPSALHALFKAQPRAYAQELLHVRITAARIQGDSGFVIFDMPGVKHGAHRVVREHGRWKVAALAGTQLP